MTTVAAEAILAIPAPTPTAPDEPGAGPRPDPTRQLQALVADGWSLTQLADAAGHQRTHRLAEPCTGTPPPPGAPSPPSTRSTKHLRLEDPGDGAAAVRSRRRAERNGWTSTTDPEGTGRQELVDEVAVDRAVDGQPSHCGPWNSRPRYGSSPAPSPTTRSPAGSAWPAAPLLRHRISQGLPAYAPVPPIEGPAR